MKIRFGSVATITVAIVLLASTAAGQIQVLTSNQLARVFNQLNEVDFENLPETDSESPPLANPLRLDGVIFSDRTAIEAGFCSSPTCEPDPDNPMGGNMGLILNPRATISFAQPRRIVVLDLQGNDTNRIGFRITDARGKNRTVVVRAPEFAPTLVGLSSPTGIREIEVVRARDSGPISLVRVLFSDPIPRYRAVPNGGPRWRVGR
jgi:hypothetical protein